MPVEMSRKSPLEMSVVFEEEPVLVTSRSSRSERFAFDYAGIRDKSIAISSVRF
jgi:hypothetical protein